MIMLISPGKLPWIMRHESLFEFALGWPWHLFGPVLHEVAPTMTSPEKELNRNRHFQSRPRAFWPSISALFQQKKFPTSWRLGQMFQDRMQRRSLLLQQLVRDEAQVTCWRTHLDDGKKEPSLEQRKRKGYAFIQKDTRQREREEEIRVYS